jgi:hypothetical protein
MSGKWRKFPYYKVQVYDGSLRIWRDERRAFGTVEAARDYAEKRISSQAARIMIVVGRRDRQVHSYLNDSDQSLSSQLRSP